MERVALNSVKKPITTLSPMAMLMATPSNIWPKKNDTPAARASKPTMILASWSMKMRHVGLVAACDSTLRPKRVRRE